MDIRPAQPRPCAFTRRVRPNGAANIHQIQWHGTRGPTSHGRQVQATENWFANCAPRPRGNDGGGWGGSADFLVGYDERTGRVEIVQFGNWMNTFASWNAGYGGSAQTTYGASEVAVSIEVAEPDDPRHSWRSEELAACLWLVDHINEQLARAGVQPVPAVDIGYWDQRRDRPIPRGHVTHYNLENGRRLGKTDPHRHNYETLLDRLARPKSSAVQQLIDAVENEGPDPASHREILNRHRAEWPTLWRAIDAVIAEGRR